MMIRKASVMHVYKDHYEEYKKRHDELWPEMEEMLKAHGVSDYSIFLLEDTGQLFAYLRVEDEAVYARVSETDICQKWWAYMEPLMETNKNNSPVSIDLTEVFYLA
ncbi:L-rhamnose mutarotase [Bacillus sp. JCM 19046]|uniref:L-rhamnose mutarotase n=2 Tax=Shouchella xiaoxiensis TaxID=766895 RepID=A0ABS2SQS9_9BACI|nr:L-rhamnose mutarotase [Shouchella xiaoxiensis]GAF11042.1 L-rhamnose mutarotase [Bacillus sp. JCM 19045]GAF19583.1 L-rhamnose mutarotase [Bacillus sp. JCM 19046]